MIPEGKRCVWLSDDDWLAILACIEGWWDEGQADPRLYKRLAAEVGEDLPKHISLACERSESVERMMA